MKAGFLVVVLTVVLVFASPAARPTAVGGGHLPARGPFSVEPCEPAQGQHPAARAANFIPVDEEGHPYVPHVDAKNDKWVGHDACADDLHYHLDHPWAHGRFTGGLGPQHVFGLALDKVPSGIAEWLAVASGRLWFGSMQAGSCCITWTATRWS